MRCDFLAAIELLRLHRVGADLGEEARALDGGVLAEHAGGIGARADDEARIAARIERRLDLRQHVFDRDHLLAGDIGATVGEYLVADEQAGGARRLERAHHLAHVVHAAESGIGIDQHRNAHRAADARVVVGHVAHVALAHVGLGQHAAERGVAAGRGRLEAFALDDPRRQRVVGPRHDQGFRARRSARENVSEFRSG